ncbi:MAG: hypothetical protein DMG21_09205 [Acidobacteria bacterium]|nr:MAG: hypothetical protein DMG21_09205 [Acidobacteriota bacterium]
MNLFEIARIYAVLGLFLSVWGGEVRSAGPTAASANFYVAPNGNDSWSGTLAAPNGAGNDGPFRTLGRARDAVRALKSQGAFEGPVTVALRGGKYFLKDTITFGTEDSGARDSQITYKNPGGRIAGK